MKNGRIRYDQTQDYVIAPDLVRSHPAVKDGRNTFLDFTSHHAMLDLRNNESVEKAFGDATKRGIFDQAADLRKTIFGNVMTTYGVSYISDSCFSTCSYCPINVDATDDSGNNIRRKTLSVEDFVRDTEQIMNDGHTHICFLAGDGMLTYNPRTKQTDPTKLLPYLSALQDLDLREAILNITPQTNEGFEQIREAIGETRYQFRVFQETYNRDVYADKHGRQSRAGKLGPKEDFEFRRNAQSRAMTAGADAYGLGVLLGLNPYLIEELTLLVEHKEELTDQFGLPPARVCLPTANELIGVNGVETQIPVSEKANELAYALTKLAMGEVSIVSSERDNPQILHILDSYASNRTVGVQPSVGGNLAHAGEGQKRLIEQTTVYPTEPRDAINDYANRGYNLKFDY